MMSDNKGGTSRLYQGHTVYCRSNDKMNMGKITLKNNIIGTEIYFETKVIYLRNYLPEVQFT